MKITVAITGASGTTLGLKLLKALEGRHETHLIVSKNAQIVSTHEHNTTIHNNTNIASSLASGSSGTDILMIVPCSMNTLAKIAHGIADDLTTRAASVVIKERRTLLLAPREMPFSSIALENMLKLSNLGAIIAPPVLAYYSKQKSLDEMEDFMIGKWLDLIGVENNMYRRWGDDA